MMTEAARKARNEYHRKWCKANPDKVRASIERHWLKKAAENEQREKDEQAAAAEG